MPIRSRQSRPVGDPALATSVRDLEQRYHWSSPHEAGFEAAAQGEVQPQLQVQVQSQPFGGMFTETDTPLKDVDKGDEEPSLVAKATMEAAHEKVRSYLDHQQRYQELEAVGDDHFASIWTQEELLETADDDHVASIGSQEELPDEVWETHIMPLNPTVCLRDLELKKSSSSSQGQIDRRYWLQEPRRSCTQRQA
ncbi:hypothetical protein E4U57_007105 [Claviceps arundinis]|uniref:Uncharacterized protein n=1 Tax=Claviceps arundinis TaxID=1623583 RepID=A0A9P7MT76_9HYPO|nr:hypothetical protein E4U57_007105 [Claviceps arundinis]KAG5970167.1 hypothetical protein E4U56_007967 [Claviceps arundinis]